MKLIPDDDTDISYALVDLKSGTVLDTASGGALGQRLADLGSAAPELFRAGAGTDFSTLFKRLGSERNGDSFQEIVLLSPTRAHVVQRVPSRPGLALVASSTDIRKVGLLLFGAHARITQLEKKS